MPALEEQTSSRRESATAALVSTSAITLTTGYRARSRLSRLQALLVEATGNGVVRILFERTLQLDLATDFRGELRNRINGLWIMGGWLLELSVKVASAETYLQCAEPILLLPTVGAPVILPHEVGSISNRLFKIGVGPRIMLAGHDRIAPLLG
jgi:hypothetical protein